MFGESRWVTALVVAGTVVVLVIFGFAINWAVNTRSGLETLQSYTTSTQTTVYVDPDRCPLCQANGNTGVLNPDGTPRDETPDVSGQGSSGSSSGGFLSGFFSGGTPKDLPAGYAAKDLSSQFRSVRIKQVTTYKGTAVTANADTVVLAENIGSNDAAVNITGWKLVSNKDSYLIQRAAKTYRTAGAQLANVTLANGQSAYVYGAASAVGANFMGNSCMGYLSSQYSFVPKLAGSCTRPAKNEIATFSGACQDYILSLKSCQAGNPNDGRIPSDDSACRSFVANLNYDGCVRTRQADEKFYTNAWNLWAGKRFLDPLHDRVLLLDANGKLVDWYVY